MKIVLFASVVKFAIFSNLLVCAQDGTPIKLSQFVPQAAVFGDNMEYDLTEDREFKSIAEGKEDPSWKEPRLIFSWLLKEPYRSSVTFEYCLSSDDAQEVFAARRHIAQQKGDQLEPINDEGPYPYFVSVRSNIRWTIFVKIENLVFHAFHYDDQGIADPEAWLHQMKDAYIAFISEKTESEDPRLWTNTSGQTFQGFLKSINWESATIDILRSDGRLFRNFPIDQLSEADIDYVRSKLKAN